MEHCNSSSQEELQAHVDALFEESDVLAHQALFKILQLIREDEREL